MLRISGGEVTYGRTVKTGDYENKRMDIKLSFGCDDGDDYDTLIAMAGQIALRRCHDALGCSDVDVLGERERVSAS